MPVDWQRLWRGFARRTGFVRVGLTGDVPRSVPPLRPEGLLGRASPTPLEPSRLLIIRLHAFGDAVLTWPVIAALRQRFPTCRIELVTDVQNASAFSGRTDLDRVWTLDTLSALPRRGLELARLVSAMRAPRPADVVSPSTPSDVVNPSTPSDVVNPSTPSDGTPAAPSEPSRPFDVVVDLQRSRLSRALTRLLRPRYWVAFDRFAPRTALTRYRDAVAWVGLPALEPVLAPRLKERLRSEARALLRAAGWRGAPLVILNPAGAWETRQWPLERFAALAGRLEQEAGCQVLLMGGGLALDRVKRLRERLGPGVIDLCGRTSREQAAALVAEASLVVSEDSGLMHLAWTQGVATVAIFGSSRGVWSRPEGPKSTGFYSEDLECGACMRAVCARGDLHCLDRVGVDAVFERCVALLGG